MSHSIERHDPGRDLSTDSFGRLPQPAWYTPEGVVDRFHQNEHLVKLRDEMRQAEATVVHQFQVLTGLTAELDAKARVRTEMKFRLQRERTESRILAGDDPDLAAKYGLLDDDGFQDYRLMLLNWDRRQ